MPGHILVTPPAVEPLTLAEAKLHLRVEHSADDTLITVLITTARQVCEAYTGRALITQTLALWLNSPFGGTTITLPRAPLQSVTSLSTFNDSDAESIYSAANYRVDTIRTPGQLVLDDDSSLPDARTVNGIKIVYVVGYGNTATDVPAALRQGMLAHIAVLYEQRGEQDIDVLLPSLSRQLYHPYKIIGVV